MAEVSAGKTLQIAENALRAFIFLQKVLIANSCTKSERIYNAGQDQAVGRRLSFTSSALRRSPSAQGGPKPWAVGRSQFPHSYKLTSTPPLPIPPLYNCGNRYGYSCYLTAASRRRGHFFSYLIWVLGPGAAVGRMRIEINTGYSCYLICNDSQYRIALQLIPELNSHSLFSVTLVCPYLSLSLSLYFSMHLSFSVYLSLHLSFLCVFFSVH